MITVKFDKSVKYAGVRYGAHVAFKVNEADIDELKNSGAIVLAVEQSATAPVPTSCDEGKECVDTQQSQKGDNVEELRLTLLEYTVAELTEFAKEREIDLMGKTRKADIYNLIVAALK